MALLILILTINAMVHFRQIEQNEFIDYERENAVSAALIFLVGVIYFFTGGSAASTFFLFIVAPSLRWIVHDLTLNYLRGLAWDYLGTRSKLDNLLRQWQQATNVHFIFLKVLAVAISFVGAYLIIRL